MSQESGTPAHPAQGVPAEYRSPPLTGKRAAVTKPLATKPLATQEHRDDCRVTVVVVTFNSAHVLDSCLASVPDGCAVIIVDNASEDAEAVEKIAVKYAARLVRNEVNLGFGPACNQCIGLAQSEFLLFLNPDATLQSGAIERLLRAADQNPARVGFSPRILSGGRVAVKTRSVLLSWSERIRDFDPETDRELPVLSGAAMFVRRTAFEAAGGFDPNIFMYHEDDDLSIRLRQRGGSLMYVSDAVVLHAGGASSRKSVRVQRLKGRGMGISRIYVMRKYAKRFVVLRALGIAIAHSANPLLLFMPFKRAKQRAYVRGIIEGVTRP